MVVLMQVGSLVGEHDLPLAGVERSEEPSGDHHATRVAGGRVSDGLVGVQDPESMAISTRDGPPALTQNPKNPPPDDAQKQGRD